MEIRGVGVRIQQLCNSRQRCLEVKKVVMQQALNESPNEFQPDLIPGLNGTDAGTKTLKKSERKREALRRTKCRAVEFEQPQTWVRRREPLSQ